MLLHKSIEHDSRVRREARALAEAGHEVTVLHLPRKHGELDGELDGFQVCSVTSSDWLGRRLPRGVLQRLLSVFAFVHALRAMRPDVIHAHDTAMLVPGWLAVRRTGALLVYDSHELATGVPYRERLWAVLVAAVERLLAPRCELVLTVSDGIATRLAQRYRLRRTPVVVRNVPDLSVYDLEGKGSCDLRAELGLPADSPLVLHLGAAALDRGCETLVRSIARTGKSVNLLFLGSDLAYAGRLGEIAREQGVGDRVHFLPAVPVRQVLAHARQASVGVSLLEDTCENHRLALPNKIFEYLAAGVPVVASDLPELRRTLADQDAAVLVDSSDESAVARAIGEAMERNRPTPPGPFAWEREAERLLSAYASLGSGKTAQRRRAVVLVRNGIDHDARVQREARLLDSIGFETTVVGVVGGGGSAERAEERVGKARIVRLDPGGRPRKLLRRLGVRGAETAAVATATTPDAAATQPSPRGARSRLRRLFVTADFYRGGLGQVLRIRPDLIHANDYNTAWIGVLGKWLAGSALIYDSHELWPDRNLRPEARSWLLLCEALFVRAADVVITTSPGYAEVMAGRYRIERPRLVRNVPEWRADTDRQYPSAESPLAVYFGALTRNRGLETALRALALVEDLRMRFVGPEAWGYRGDLVRLAVRLGVNDRLEILDPVPPERAATVLSRRGPRSGADRARMPQLPDDAPQQALRVRGGGTAGARQRGSRVGHRGPSARLGGGR